MRDDINRADFAIVVDWLPRGDADEAWQVWKDSHSEASANLDLALDVIVDNGRTSDGNHRRSSVRQTAIRDR